MKIYNDSEQCDFVIKCLLGIVIRIFNRVEPRINSSLKMSLSAVFFLGRHKMGWMKSIQNEIKVIRERDPAIHSDMEVFLYPSFKVMLHYRIAHKLYLKEHYFLARWISQRGVRKTGIEIHPGAQIG